METLTIIVTATTNNNTNNTNNNNNNKTIQILHALFYKAAFNVNTASC